MKKFTLLLLFIAIIIVIVVLFVNTKVSSDGNLENEYGGKNIIFMVPDGMGLADVTAARIYKNGLNGSPLFLEGLENIGYQRTYSANYTITDSAAAASAWACGEKFNNKEICYHSNGRSYNSSLLEISKAQGKATGLVVTSRVTHATPAAFGAHARSRTCENEIARQLIEETKVDVMLNADLQKFNSTKPDECGFVGNLIPKAVRNGYSLVYTREEMQRISRNGSTRLLGFFASDMTPEFLRPINTTEPRLSEMTSAALDILEEDKDGFFLMVEGSNIDPGNEGNNLTYQIHEVLGFDDAVKVVLDWINARPERKANTLLVIAPDHESGGFAIDGPTDRIIKKGEYVEAGWTVHGHTGVDTVIWSQGPGSNKLGKAIDNTEIYRVIAAFIKNQDIP